MGDLISENKAAILKILTGVATGLCLWLNKKYQIDVPPDAIAAIGVSIVLGLALHAAAKDHGVSAAPDTKEPDPPAPGQGGKAAGLVLLFILIPFLSLGCQGVRLDKKVMGDYKAAHDIVLPEYQAFLDGKPPTLTDAQKDDRRKIILKLQEIDAKGVQ